jgi:hypothetical protein
MKTLRWRTWGVVARDTRGAEIAETAMVLPLVFMMLLAIFWFGQAFRTYGTLTHAARQGARAAVAPVCATCAAASSSNGNTPAQNAQTAVQNALVAAHLAPDQLVPWGPKWTAPQLCACMLNNPSPSCTTGAVSCDGSVLNVCVQENVQLSYPSQGGAGTCGTSVSMRYQYSSYHFYIPLTTLDFGNLLLPGQAEMRVETQ